MDLGWGWSLDLFICLLPDVTTMSNSPVSAFTITCLSNRPAEDGGPEQSLLGLPGPDSASNNSDDTNCHTLR